MINKISKRMLRYYDEKGLLKPRRDKETGYRYYNDSDVERSNKIKLLRKYDFSVEEIKEILVMNLSQLKSTYKNKIEMLEEKTSEYFDVIEEMKTYINSDFELNMINPYDIYIGKKESFYGLCIRRVVNEHELELLIDELMDVVDKIRPILNGRYFVIFHSVEEGNSDLFDVEVCQPILDKMEVKDYKVKFFESKYYINTIHIGSYDTISYAYSALHNWAHLNDYSLIEPYIEKYYVDEYMGVNQNQFITEISVSIKKD
jgi:DNA-binding transcriptional MerR regulator